VVDGGHIEAGGRVDCYGNILGQQKTSLRSAGSIRGSYVDAATLDSQQDILLTRGVRRSHLRAGRSVLVQGEHSYILGGTVQACERILSHDIGSERELPTRVEILPELFDTAIQERFVAHLATLLEADQRQLTQTSIFEAGPAAVQTIHALLHQCRNALPQFVEYFQMRHGILPPVPLYTGIVAATGTVYPGVTICIGNASLVITQPVSHVLFYQTAGRIHSTPLDSVDLEDGGAT
jgi:uncharacterized protein (DUF342 family)